MTKKGNLFIKLQLEKEETTGHLLLNVFFDKNAPNLFCNDAAVNWYPTMDELKFINETFALLNNQSASATNPPPASESPSSHATEDIDETELVTFEEQPVTASEVDDNLIVPITDPNPPSNTNPEHKETHLPEMSPESDDETDTVFKQVDDKRINKAVQEQQKKAEY